MNVRAPVDVTVDGLDPIQGQYKSDHWHAFLRLKFAKTARGVRLVEKAHFGPLYIQKPFYPEGLETPHAYILHPPGGLVSGDTLDVRIDVEKDAHALCTTPGAGRMYKARNDLSPQKQSTKLNVAEGGVIEWLPLEAILFPSAHAVIENEIRLQEKSHCIFWDVVSLGLPANKEAFSVGSFNQSVKLYRNNRLILQERFLINDATRFLLNEHAGLQGNVIQGVMLAGPLKDGEVELIEKLRAIADDADELAGVSMVSSFIVIRALGACSEKMRNFFTKCWQEVRPVILNKEACPPRIWKT